ncbi:MAG TPA: hypothetical protein VFF26_02245 [Gallionella sp.]|nr:hypothetical protein [Gallionella sp.]
MHQIERLHQASVRRQDDGGTPGDREDLAASGQCGEIEMQTKIRFADHARQQAVAVHDHKMADALALEQGMRLAHGDRGSHGDNRRRHDLLQWGFRPASGTHRMQHIALGDDPCRMASFVGHHDGRYSLLGHDACGLAYTVVWRETNDIAGGNIDQERMLSVIVRLNVLAHDCRILNGATGYFHTNQTDMARQALLPAS